MPLSERGVEGVKENDRKEGAICENKAGSGVQEFKASFPTPTLHTRRTVV
jgi:hypothetical protein